MKLSQNFNVQCTKGKIYRYMKLNKIKSITRKKKQKYTISPHLFIPNLILRNFKADKPNSKWSIDISYLLCSNGRVYLCAIKDMYDKSIVAYYISNKLDTELVMTTVKKSLEQVKYEERQNLILHSDQGVQFKSYKYVELLKSNNITQSMSYKGNCVDNSPIESFFSALKSEEIYLHKSLTKKQMIISVNNYILYYNTERQQEKLKELTPITYRKLALNVLY